MYAACDTRNGMHHHIYTQHAIRDDKMEQYVTFRATVEAYSCARTETTAINTHALAPAMRDDVVSVCRS